MVEERTENQELMAALDNIQGELKGIKKKGAKQVFPDYCCGYPDSCDRSRSGRSLRTALG